MARSQRPMSDYGGGRPVGHVMGHAIGEPRPPARDPHRLPGRTGPYADVTLQVDGRPAGHWIGGPGTPTVEVGPPAGGS